MLTRDFVATVYIVNDAEVLLVFHKKLNAWLPPGGHIDENELPCDAARREALEETGFEVKLIGEEEPLGKGVKKLVHPRVVQLEDIQDGHQHIDLVYYGIIASGKLKLNGKEHSNIKWFSANELDSNEIIESVRVYGKRAIEELGNNKIQ